MAVNSAHCRAHPAGQGRVRLPPEVPAWAPPSPFLGKVFGARPRRHQAAWSGRGRRRRTLARKRPLVVGGGGLRGEAAGSRCGCSRRRVWRLGLMSGGGDVGAWFWALRPARVPGGIALSWPWNRERSHSRHQSPVAMDGLGAGPPQVLGEGHSVCGSSHPRASVLGATFSLCAARSLAQRCRPDLNPGGLLRGWGGAQRLTSLGPTAGGHRLCLPCR